MPANEAQIDAAVKDVVTRTHKALQPQRKPYERALRCEAPAAACALCSFVLKDGETPLVLLDVECSNGWVRIRV